MMRKRVTMLILAAVTAFCCLGLVACGEKKISVTFHGATDKVIEAVAGKEIELPAAPGKAGYTFGGWFADKNLSNPFDEKKGYKEDIEVWAKFTPNTNTAYKVEHYTEKLDGTYEVEVTDNLTGTTDTSATAQAKTIEHFTYDPDADGAVLSGKIAGDGSLVLKLYYTRNSYAVTFKNGSATLATQNFRYGETPVYAGETPVKDAAGKMFYAFKGWDRAFAPVDSACEYAAAFYEIPSFESWYYCEQTAVALPDLTAFFPGATLKHFVNDIEIDPANATMQVGTQEWKVEVYVGEGKLSEMTQRFEVLSAANYARQFADGSSEQYIQRFLHEGCTAFTYNETENAYEFKTVDSINTWSARLQPKDDLVSDGTWKLTTGSG